MKNLFFVLLVVFFSSCYESVGEFKITSKSEQDYTLFAQSVKDTSIILEVIVTDSTYINTQIGKKVFIKKEKMIGAYFVQ